MRRTNWFRKVVTAIVALGLVCQMSFSGTVAYAAWDDNDTWESVQGWNDNENDGWEEVDEEDENEVIDCEDEDEDIIDDSEDESGFEDDWDDVDDEDEIDEEDEIEVEEPTLSSTSLKLKAGSVAGLTVNGDYEYVENWTSSKPSVAKVDSNGAVKAVKAGTTVITAEVVCFVEDEDEEDFFDEDEEDFFEEDEEDFFEEDEEEEEGKEITFTLKCKVTVTAPTIKISAKKLTIKKGKSAKLKITGTTAKVTWKSSNKKVATVSKGTVKAKKAGKTTITAKVSGKTFKCSVTVKKK